MRFLNSGRDDDEKSTPTATDHVSSDPVAVPRQTGRDDAGDDRLPPQAIRDDGSFDDPAVPAPGPQGGATDAGETVAKPVFGTDLEDSVARSTATDDDRHATLDEAADRRADEFAFHEPAPQPTAFGAATVGGAVAASALAGGNSGDDDRSGSDRRTDAASGVADDRLTTVGSPRPVPDPVDIDLDEEPERGGTTYQSAAADDADRPASTDRDDDRPDRTDDRQPDDAVTAVPADLDLTDDRPDRTDDGPVLAAGPDVGGPDRDDDGPILASGQDGGDPDRDDDGQRSEPGPEAAAVPVDGQSPAVAVPVGGQLLQTAPAAGQLPGPVPAASAGPLFDDGEAHQLRDRWRDVQLRFVDDPRAAAGEARALIDEAVESLTATLHRQRDGLGTADTDDTERLRVLIRHYRDFLDRLLAL